MASSLLVPTRTVDESSIRTPLLCPICGKQGSVPHLQAPDRFHLGKELYQLVRCPACSPVWLENPPAPEEMPHHYGEAYHRAVTVSGETKPDARWRAPRDRVLKMASGGALLDIGCSSDAFLRTFKGGGWDLYGIEISAEEARKAEVSTGARVHVGDVLDAPFPSRSFDVITCFHVLEHVYRPVETISKAWDWLKYGGIFYLAVPNIESLEASIFRSYWYGLELPLHLCHFSPASLRCLFEPSGFEELLLHTNADCYVEQSVRYVFDDLLMKVGISRSPLAAGGATPSIAWKAFRKAFRLGFLSPFRRLAAITGHGAAIEAVFRKR